MSNINIIYSLKCAKYRIKISFTFRHNPAYTKQNKIAVFSINKLKQLEQKERKAYIKSTWEESEPSKAHKSSRVTSEMYTEIEKL